jgi:hypothetical protein
MTFRGETTVLTSWKDIARYMGKGVRTVQRWERQLGLPVRRPTGAQHKSAVLVDRSDLDAWLATRFSSRPASRNLERVTDNPANSARAVLREKVRAARELRAANQVLIKQLCDSIRVLNERCNMLAEQTLLTGLNTATPPVTNSVEGRTFTESKRIA